MSGGTYFRFRVGGTGKSSSHMMYISRESAVIDKEQDMVMRNLPEDVKEARNYSELKTNLASYAWAREESEQARFKGAGEVRTHYRCTVSFEKNVDPEKAKQMVNEWLEKEFSQAKSVAFIHRDTDHQHAHIWIDARKLDGKKIDLSKDKYRKLDESWNKIYSREMGRDYKEHLEKKEQTRQHKAAYVRGEKTDKPERVYNNSRGLYQDREQRNIGVNTNYEKGRDRRSQPNIADRDKEIKTEERRIGSGDRGTENKLYAGEARERTVGKEVIERSRGEQEFGKYTEESQRGHRAVQQELQKDEPRKGEDSRGEQEIDKYSEESKRADKQFDRTESEGRGALRETKELRQELTNLRERDKEIDRDRGFDFGR